MKNNLFIAASIMAVSSNAQITTLGNVGTAPDYVGWDNTNAFPLQIRHIANQEIHTYTNNLMRMKIVGGGGMGTIVEVTKKILVYIYGKII